MGALTYLENIDVEFPNTLEQRTKKFSVRDAYRVVSWVYSCVNVIANCMSGTPFVLFTEDEEGNRTPLPKNHPAEALLRNPCPGKIPSRSEMIRLQVVYHELFGESFLRMVKVKKRQTIELMNPLRMANIMDEKTGALKWWEYTPKTGAQAGGRNSKLILQPEEVIQWKYPNPYDEYRGLAPLTATRLALEQDINMSVWNAGFFMSGLKNPLALLVKQTLDPRQRKQFIDGILQSYAGFYRGQMPLLLEGGTDVKVLSNTMKDLDFIEGKQLTREEILTVYSVPPAQVGIFRYANYSNSKEQRKLLYTNNAKPKMIYYRDVFQTNFLDVYFPGVSCDWDWDSVDALREDPKVAADVHYTIAQAAKVYWDMGYSRAEIALILHSPDLNPDMDEDDSDMQEPDPDDLMDPEDTPTLPSEEEEDDEESDTTPKPKPKKKPKAPSKTIGLLPYCVKTSQNKDEIVRSIPLPAAKSYAAATAQEMKSISKALESYRNTFLEQAVGSMSKKALDEAFWLSAWDRLMKNPLANVYRMGVRSALANLHSLAKRSAQVGAVPRISLNSPKPGSPTENSMLEELDQDFQVVQERSQSIARKVIAQLNEIRSGSSSPDNTKELVGILLNRIKMQNLVSFVYNRARYKVFEAAGVTEQMWCSENGMNGTKNKMGGLFLGEGVPGSGVLFPGQSGGASLDVVLPTKMAKNKVGDFREMA